MKEEPRDLPPVACTALLDDLLTVEEIARVSPELHPCNYTHDEVCRLNTAMCELYEVVRKYRPEENKNIQATQILPPVLDACCGPRMMWFDRSDERALFIDCRRETVRGAWGPASVGRNDVVIDPDQIADFTALPFPDSSFWHVVFDPPHIERTAATGKVTMTFGVLTPGWEDRLRKGFSECFRVLRSGGTLVFKWCEVEIPLARVLALTPERPLYGHRSGAKARTHWVAFLKSNPQVSEPTPGGTHEKN